jgi:hypothetical protein
MDGKNVEAGDLVLHMDENSVNQDLPSQRQARIKQTCGIESTASYTVLANAGISTGQFTVYVSTIIEAGGME